MEWILITFCALAAIGGGLAIYEHRRGLKIRDERDARDPQTELRKDAMRADDVFNHH